MPNPDDFGRYRVRRKGDTSSPAWSTRNFNPDRHVIVPGSASDTYGNALPPKPHRRLELTESAVVDSGEVPASETTDEKEGAK